MRGRLVIIGGAEDKHGESRVLKHVVESIRNSNPKMVVLTTAAEKPDEAGREYRNAFGRLGLNNVEVLNVDTRDDANLDSNAVAIVNSSGIFFTGGDQLRITSILGGTRVHTALRTAFQNGATIIGTSAGASAMSNTMIVRGNDNEPARKCTLKMAPGLGFLEDAIIDQHFDQRGRIGRLLCGIAQNPYMLGIGIDEDTAIVVYPDRYFEVIGTNAVTVIDGNSIKISNVSELKPDEILAIINVTLHVLPHGYGFSLEDRSVVLHGRAI